MKQLLNCDCHKLEFPDLYPNRKHATLNELEIQHDKFFEEIEEMFQEKEDIFTNDFRMELLDVIASGLNLYKVLTLYMKEDNKNYMEFIYKINRRLENGQLKIRK